MKVTQLSKRRVFSGRAIQVDEVDLDFGNGKKSTYELVGFKVVTGVSALPVEGKYVYLIRHYQAGIDTVGYSLPTGGLNAGEDPQKRIQLELMEELGMKAGKLTLLTRVHSLPGYIGAEAGYIYLAENLKPEKRAGDEEFDIEVVKLDLDKALDLVREGVIIDGRTMLGLLYYAQFCRRKNA